MSQPTRTDPRDSEYYYIAISIFKVGKLQILYPEKKYPYMYIIGKDSIIRDVHVLGADVNTHFEKFNVLEL